MGHLNTGIFAFFAFTEYVFYQTNVNFFFVEKVCLLGPIRFFRVFI